MEYISAEEFLKQSEKVKQSLLDWWKPSIGDLVSTKAFGIGTISIETNVGYTLEFVKTRIDKFVPLLTEGQLRKFIEDKTGGKVCCDYYSYIFGIGYEVEVCDSDNNFEHLEITGYLENLLEAYWDLVCKLVEKE